MVPAGADRLLFLPYLAGERAPIWDPDARGAFIGLTLNHGAREMGRAVVESVAYAVRDVIEVYSGGAGWSNFVMVMLFLIIFPFFTFMRRAAFETSRWAESDHAPVSSGDSSDGDD